MNPSISTPTRPVLVPHAAVSARVLIWSFLAGIALTLPVLWLISLLPLPSLAGNMEQAKVLRIAQIYAMPGLLFLKAVILYPLLEELFYRGLFQQMLRRYLPLGVAIVLPNLVFAITHIGSGWTNVVFALFVGLFHSWLVIRSGSLLPAILSHAAINTLVIFVIRPLADSGAIVYQAGRFPVDVGGFILPAVSLVVFLGGCRLLRGEFFPAKRALAA